MSFPRLQLVVPTDSPADLARFSSLITLAVFLTDLATKNWALAMLGSGHAEFGLVALTVIENDGLAFSAGAGSLTPLSVVALRLGALAAVLGLAWRYGSSSLRFAVGFALVLGGGLGNASDTVFRDGVVDFISTAPLIRAVAGSPTAEGFVMNLADIWILTGLALLYPLFRVLGKAAQRRFMDVESRILGREW
ncbi:MAG: hypothetical protein GWM90_05235 [Gemmatimonadetes bacterium]|nr:signal peptidase II [Gemmatimonadota bacterium]NIQ53137.1 signal peptidase II [Gemmatimonadota bacterium]NIU73284.1 hypothetical protein [Gammaproteobacteria bacterium]NIX43543.1 hypothetical protein [Gemmatimonadota bacterium]NIY07725.1 hypothetical protein [Gemmatimonadota bacterium]